MKLRDPCGQFHKCSQHPGLKVPTENLSVKRWLTAAPLAHLHSGTRAAL